MSLNVQFIPVAHIVEDPEQPRKQLDEESLRGLADSIRQHGLLNPITVTPLPDARRYRIVTGERRWRAAQMARLEAIPCIVREVDADARLTEQLIENLQREDLQPLEKARAVQHVRQSLNLTNREVAHRLGLSERTVREWLSLLDLPEEIGEAVVSSPNRPANGQITGKHARHLRQLNEDPELQSAVVERIREEHLTSEATANLVRALKQRPDRAQEILDTPAEHLLRFFQDAPGMESEEVPEEASMPFCSIAQRVLEFRPMLEGVGVESLSHPELRQLEDALTALQMTVRDLLARCKALLEA